MIPAAVVDMDSFCSWCKLREDEIVILQEEIAYAGVFAVQVITRLSITSYPDLLQPSATAELSALDPLGLAREYWKVQSSRPNTNDAIQIATGALERRQELHHFTIDLGILIRTFVLIIQHHLQYHEARLHAVVFLFQVLLGVEDECEERILQQDRPELGSKIDTEPDVVLTL